VLRVGTSGWAYDWTEFYPRGLVKPDQLAFYATQFGSVEVNYTFYQLPTLTAYERWASDSPADFVFALKASRLITHVQRLSGVRGAWSAFLAHARALGGKLGPLLVQVPPSLQAEASRVHRFLRMTHGLERELGLEGLRMAFEARHESWFERPVLTVLEKHGAALAFAHSTRFPYPVSEPLTSDFVYLRFHGPAEMCASPYGSAGLAPWAKKIEKWLRAGRDVYAYFNNDVDGHAPRDAAILIEMVEGGSARAAERKSKRRSAGNVESPLGVGAEE
jgi:uncharacterized protein YecE (DUF72 family)